MKVKSYGDMEIISGKTSTHPNKHVIVKCAVCGTIREVREYSLKRGIGTNCLHACTKSLNDGSDKFKRIRSTYFNFVGRIENVNAEAYKYYGGKGIENKFESFALFYLMVKDMYDEAVRIHGVDIALVRIDSTKDFCIENIKWIPASEARKQADHSTQRIPIVGISPDGVKYEGESITQFARDHGLQKSHISSCLSGKSKTYKGWTFYRK